MRICSSGNKTKPLTQNGLQHQIKKLVLRPTKQKAK